MFTKLLSKNLNPNPYPLWSRKECGSVSRNIYNKEEQFWYYNFMHNLPHSELWLVEEWWWVIPLPTTTHHMDELYTKLYTKDHPSTNHTLSREQFMYKSSGTRIFQQRNRKLSCFTARPMSSLELSIVASGGRQYLVSTV